MSGLKDEDATYGLDEIAARLEALLGRPHMSVPYVRFRIELVKAQWAVREALARATPHADDPAAPGTIGGQRDPDARPPGAALDPDSVPFDLNLLQSLFSAIRSATVQHGRQSEDMRLLAGAVQADAGLLPALARKAAFGPDVDFLESLARQLRVLPDVLLFVGRSLAAPCVVEAVRRLAARPERLKATTETSGRCRMCGSPPALSTLRRGDGRRVLTCGLCGTAWEFTRLACPWCESRDREALGLLRLAPEDPRWIETCEACRGYIKTVDERRLPVGETVIPVVEEAATLHLDLLAEREGYIRRLPYTLSG